MIISEKNIYVLNLICKIIYFISTCLLSYICIFMNRLIIKHKLEYLENYNNLFDPNILTIGNSDVSDIGVSDNDETKENNNEKNTSEKKDNNNNNEDKNESQQKEEVFYHIKKKQNRWLYIINLFCSSVELIFTVIRYFIMNEDFLEDVYEIVPLTIPSEILFYVYILICFVNVSVIFFCFYYYIRRQYSRDTKVYKKRLSKKILDDAFIEEQKKKEDSLGVNEGVLTTNKIKRKNSSLDDNF